MKSLFRLFVAVEHSGIVTTEGLGEVINRAVSKTTYHVATGSAPFTIEAVYSHVDSGISR